MNDQGLWKGRFLAYSREMQKYLKYIFNGHLVFVMVIAAGGIGYYYSEWIKTLDADFPAVPILAAVFALIMTNSPILTFFREADLVFLLPLETKLKGYAVRSIILSTVMQAYIILIIWAAGLPLYAKVTGSGLPEFLIFLGAMVLLKLLNLVIRWFVLKYQDPSALRADSLVRLALNLVFLYFLFAKAAVWLTAAVMLLVIGLLFYYRKAVEEKPLKWERLIELEAKRMLAFYRIANMFTDVPKLKGKAARRKWLDWLLSAIPYRRDSAYLYLYARTMLRTNDYAGLLVRLSLIGSVILLAFTSPAASVLVTVVMLYMTGIQLLPVWKDHEMKVWVSLYPLPDHLRSAAVARLVSYFLYAETGVFVIVLSISGNWQGAGAALVSGIVFSMLFKIYAIRKIAGFREQELF